MYTIILNIYHYNIIVRVNNLQVNYNSLLLHLEREDNNMNNNENSQSHSAIVLTCKFVNMWNKYNASNSRTILS